MRAFKTTLSLLVLLLVVPAPAQAWFGWLDNLSGPGPFNGAEFDFKLLCFMDQPSWQQAVAAKQSLVDFENFSKTMMAAATVVTPAARQNNQLREDIGRLSMDLFMDIEKLSAKLNLQQIGIPDQHASEDALAKVHAGFQRVFKALDPPLSNEQMNTLKILQALETAVERTSSMLRGARVPTTSEPSLGFWASCSDRLRHETPGLAGDIRHEDRHPVASIVLNYRDLANSKLFHLFSDVARDGGDAIHLRILEPKLSWPITGRFDFLDGEAGAGIYRFSSTGFTGAKSFHGLVFEPIRFNLHAPGSLIEKYAAKCTCLDRFLTRLALSVSYSAGVLMFPGGFSTDRFISGKPGDVGREIPGGEAIFEQGIVINVGRLFGL
jgi:hypothetical protein